MLADQLDYVVGVDPHRDSHALAVVQVVSRVVVFEATVVASSTRREANRCLKRYLARNLYRLLEHPPTTA